MNTTLGRISAALANLLAFHTLSFSNFSQIHARRRRAFAHIVAILVVIIVILVILIILTI